jgi:hypothetical protein
MRCSSVVSAVLVAVVDVTLIVVAVTTYLGGDVTSPSASASASHAPSSATPMKREGAVNRAAIKRASRGSSTIYHPLRVVPPETAVERTVNQAFITNSNPSVLSPLEGSTFPAPATSAPFHVIDPVDSQSASLYAVAFTQELLDIHFGSSSRRQLLAWANYNNAQYSLNDLPGSLATKVLDLSLTTVPSPVPNRTQWSALASSRTSWRLSGLVISVNPTWTQALSAGWVPVDPLMVIYDVSGSLTISRPGHATVVESIGFGLTLGGASLHPGYGAVALNDWTVN